MIELKCPHCGGRVICDDVYATDIENYYITEYCVGHCSACNAILQWEKDFIFSRINKMTDYICEEEDE